MHAHHLFRYCCSDPFGPDEPPPILHVCTSTQRRTEAEETHQRPHRLVPQPHLPSTCSQLEPRARRSRLHERPRADRLVRHQFNPLTNRLKHTWPPSLFAEQKQAFGFSFRHVCFLRCRFNIPRRQGDIMGCRSSFLPLQINKFLLASLLYRDHVWILAFPGSAVDLGIFHQHDKELFVFCGGAAEPRHRRGSDNDPPRMRAWQREQQQ